jgi:hypothetical protein
MMHNKKAKVGASKMGKVATAKPKMGSASKRADGIAKKGLTRAAGGGMAKMMAGGGKAKMMASGGMPMVMKDGNKVPAFAADGKGKMAAGGRAKMMAGGGMSKMMKSGGRV